jgi:hypothetical protein
MCCRRDWAKELAQMQGIRLPIVLLRPHNRSPRFQQRPIASR